MSTVSEQRAEVFIQKVDSAIEKKGLFTGRSSSLLAVVGLTVGAARVALVEVEASAVLRVTIYLIECRAPKLRGRTCTPKPLEKDGNSSSAGGKFSVSEIAAE
jgi:hypothetical protein